MIYDPKDIEDSEWYSVFDFDPKQVVITRNQIFERAVREKALLLATHVPFPGLGYISKQAGGWDWKEFQATK